MAAESMASQDALAKSKVDVDDLLSPPEDLDFNLEPVVQMDVDSTLDKEDQLDWSETSPTMATLELLDNAEPPASNTGHSAEVTGGDNATPLVHKSVKELTPQALREIQTLRAEVARLNVKLGIAQELEKRAGRDTDRLREAEKEVAQLKERCHNLDSQAGERVSRYNSCRDELDRVLDDRTILGRQNDELRRQLEDYESGRGLDPQRKRFKTGDQRDAGGHRPLLDNSGSSTLAAGDAATRPSRGSAVTRSSRGMPPNLESIGYDAPPAMPEGCSTDPRYAVDKRGYPLTQVACERMLILCGQGHYWTYAFRLLVMWAYSRTIPKDKRNPAQEYVLKNFVMMDWVANTLLALARQKNDNRTLCERFDRMSRARIEYDPITFAQQMQFRESALKGCPFIDDAWTLNLQLVRGANLFEVLAIPRSHADSIPEPERLARQHLEKIMIELFATPGLYLEIIEGHDFKISDKFRPVPWPLADAHETTMVNVVATWAVMGVSLEHIEDAWFFGYTWLIELNGCRRLPPVWTRETLDEVLKRSAAGFPADGLGSDTNEIFPRHPALPWLPRAERIIHYDTSDWASKLLVGMQREKGSYIQALIDKGLQYRQYRAGFGHPLCPHRAYDHVYATSTARHGPGW
ncbi:hypothetical protein DFH09DRAFT_1083665 [Mycena vulgaris]|nr:hypothetical protein DFH09DRAFT_1083665 [Mycena vulgaris]